MAKANGTNGVAKTILATRTSQLPVYLTEPEIREAGKRLAHLEGELNAHAAREKDVKDDLKAKRSSLEGQVHALAGTIRQGYEYRPTSVRIEADFAAGKVFEIREDTGEVIGERPVNETDRQSSIFDAQPRSIGDVVQKVVTDAERKVAERAELERQGDELLDNAGDGALTAKDLKGEAVARKKGARRG